MRTWLANLREWFDAKVPIVDDNHPWAELSPLDRVDGVGGR